MTLLGLVIVRANLRAQLDLLDHDHVLVLARQFRLLFLFVLVLRVVHHATDGRTRVCGDFDEVEVEIPRVFQRVVPVLQTNLLTICANQAHLRDTNRLIDTRPRLFRGTVESATWSQDCCSVRKGGVLRSMVKEGRSFTTAQRGRW